MKECLRWVAGLWVVDGSLQDCVAERDDDDDDSKGSMVAIRRQLVGAYRSFNEFYDVFFLCVFVVLPFPSGKFQMHPAMFHVLLTAS